ncbi:RNA polymerase sigma factor [Lederbergia sp. NSJ-179]|uniref:RNA polymerase sigma factor n=1 Tax=Lederbergia sp. NSJ-179 TaxID=2931402 RepID=UPI001FD28800|nr:RNA polymerase sigma factor [Lederbergia sp. NSJ-179]MCJ7841915.1 RNA polymerase sigma factor [Lederbergia sp. NSJ-179]
MKKSRFHQSVFNSAYGITKDYQIAEDIVQETFIKLIENPPDIRDEHLLQKWLNVTASNLSVDYLRKMKRQEINMELFFNQCSFLFSTWHSKVERELENKLFVELLSEALDILPREWSQIVLLKYYYEMSIEEISTLLSVKKNTVKTRLLRAKQKLSRHLSKNDDIIERLTTFTEKTR